MARALEPRDSNIGSRQQQRRRSDYSDLGCLLPEESTNLDYSSFNKGDDDDDDEKTVVMGNRDSRPKHIGRLEKLHSLSNITQDQKDARDRQLIEMYTRPRPGDKRTKNKKKAKSSPSRMGMGNVYNPHNPQGSAAPSSSRQLLQQQQQQQQLPPKGKSSPNRSLSCSVTTSSARSVASQVLEQFYPYFDLVVTDSPMRKVTNSPASVSKNAISSEDAKHEVILPPFSPRKQQSKK
jgi:hypothetical protein